MCFIKNFLLFQRLVSEHFDKSNGSQFIRICSVLESNLESDPPCETSSPHLVATLVNK